MQPLDSASGRGFVSHPAFLNSALVSDYVCCDAHVGELMNLSIYINCL
jgi:hypothetical protein